MKKLILIAMGVVLLQGSVQATPATPTLYFKKGIVVGDTNPDNLTLTKGIYMGSDTSHYSSIILSPYQLLDSTSSGENSVLIGAHAVASGINAVAMGSNSSALLDDSVALGSRSVANTAAGKMGYLANGNTSATWTSTASALSVGDTENGVTRQITGVAAGTEATDAVNVAQLKTVNDNIGRDIGRVGAHAAALAALKPLQYDRYQKLQAMVGYGKYLGQSAVAIGLAYSPNEDVMVNVGSTLNPGAQMVNAGVSFKFGRGEKYKKLIPAEYQETGVVSSIYDLQIEVKSLRKESQEAKQRAEQAEQSAATMREELRMIKEKLKM